MESLSISNDSKLRAFPNLNVQTIKEHPYFEVAQQRIVEYYRRHGLKSEKDVYVLTRAGLIDPIIGTKKNCKNEDHCSPFSFIADVLLGKIDNYIVWANRSGSKSYFAALITWIKSSFIPRLETTILGGSLEQSEKSYKAMNDFWLSTGLHDQYLKSDPMMRKTEWKWGSLVSVLAAGPKSVRGPHPNRLVMDEIDEMDEEIYNAALSQPQSKYGIKASIGRLSTNHKTGGVMDKAIQKAEESGTKIYRWCIWESLQSCRDYNCSTCKLSSYCPGKHMKQADGYYLIDDFVQKLYELSDMSLQVEWLCSKIGRDDLIYGMQYEKTIHSALDLPGFNPSLPVYLSIDWGGTNPFSVGAWQKFKEIGWVRVDEVYMGNTTNKRVLKECKTRPWWRKVKEGVADPARSDLRKEWGEEGVSLYKGDTDVDEGIEAVRDAMSPVLGNPLFYINRKCRDWIKEVGAYSEKNGVPIKENDHCYDDKTEIMTEKGWKLFKSLDKTEKVATMNNNRKLEWKRPKEYQEYDYQGKLYTYDGRLNFAVTPNHNMLVVNQFDAIKIKKDRFRFKRIEEILISLNKENRGKRNRAKSWWIPASHKSENFGMKSINNRIDPYFLGFWIAEGCKSISRKRKYIHIDNKNEKILLKAVKNIKSHSKAYKTTNAKRISIRSDEIYDLLPNLKSYEKRIPRWFMENASYKELYKCYEGLMDGDGCRQKVSSHYTTTSKGLADDFQELLVRIGKRGKLTKIEDEGYRKSPSGISKCKNVFRIIINDERKYHILKAEKVKAVSYNGKISCVTVDNHIVLVRRKGFVFWCGQSMDDTKYFVRRYIKRRKEPRVRSLTS